MRSCYPAAAHCANAGADEPHATAIPCCCVLAQKPVIPSGGSAPKMAAPKLPAGGMPVGFAVPTNRQLALVQGGVFTGIGLWALAQVGWRPWAGLSTRAAGSAFFCSAGRGALARLARRSP